MERRVLTSLATKLGISTDNIIRKAEEYMCLVDVRSGSSSVAVLRPSGACKAAMCLELAATACGDHVDRANAIRLSGMNKKLYMNALRAVQCLLDLQPNVTIPDLAVQLGVTQAKPLAIEILQRHEAEHQNEDSAMYCQALYNGAALQTACRRLKMKLDKKKLVDMAGVKASTFDRLVALMDKQADKLINADKQSVRGKRQKTLVDKLEAMEEDDEVTQAKLPRHNPTEEEEDYEVWKRAILVKAYAAVGRTYKVTS